MSIAVRPGIGGSGSAQGVERGAQNDGATQRKSTVHLTLEQIEIRYRELGPFQWLHPRNVEGIDTQRLKEFNKDRWFKMVCTDEDSIREDLVVVEYLLACIRRSNDSMGKDTPYSGEIEITSDVILDAVAYMISDWGSSFAAVMFAVQKGLITEDNAERNFDMLLMAHGKAEPFIKDIYRDFILEIYRYGPLWKPPTGAFSRSLRKDQNESMTRLFDNMYVTINNSNCRFFSDGRRRW